MASKRRQRRKVYVGKKRHCAHVHASTAWGVGDNLIVTITDENGDVQETRIAVTAENIDRMPQFPGDRGGAANARVA
jgi:hypothetical protein